MAEGRAILVIGPAWIGDMVMAQSLFMVLKARRPDAAIDVVGPPWSVPLVARMPEVRRGFPLQAGHGELGLGARLRLGRELAGAGYAQAIVLPRSFKSALVPWFARIPRRTGFSTELRRLVLNDTRPLDRATLDQTVKRFVALGIGPGESLPRAPQPALRIDGRNRSDLLTRLDLRGSRAVAFMPGAAYGPAKQWPLEHFAGLAERLAAVDIQTWVLGSAAERPLGERIAAASPGSVRNLCGETQLVDTVDLLSAATAAVTNDSGLMHVAAAAGTHVIAIYGSSSPAFTPPLTTASTVVYQGLPCSPCFQRECPLGHLRCLRDITPAQVAGLVLRQPGLR